MRVIVSLSHLSNSFHRKNQNFHKKANKLMEHFIAHFKRFQTKFKMYIILCKICITTLEINIKKCNYIYVGYMVAFQLVNVGNLLYYYKNKVV